MLNFIEDCLKPLYEIRWLKEVPIEPWLRTRMLMYVAAQDNRLMMR